MSSTDTRPGRHRLALDVPAPAAGVAGGRHAGGPRRAAGRRPSLVPRSVTVVAATVGAVFVLGVDRESPAPLPHPDAPDAGALTAPALQPVVPAPDEQLPARLAAVPAGVTGGDIAGAHTAGFASLPAGPDVVRARVAVAR